MRNSLCQNLIHRAENPEMLFLTGDLGFMALEPLRDRLKERFINAGVAEQNMVTVAAALAHQKFEVWVYSIAPFIYARAFEQIRNDICLHNLPVKLIGNGGGFHYGVMGPTHHAIEDYGVLLTLPNMKAYIPIFTEDLNPIITSAAMDKCPSYIRLGRSEKPNDYNPPMYQPLRQLTAGNGPVVIAIGPLAGSYIESFQKLPDDVRPNLWGLSELPFANIKIPTKLIDQLRDAKGLCIAEEHVKQGSAASQILLTLTEMGIAIENFRHLYATSHQFKYSGSQNYLRECSGVNVENVISVIKSLNCEH